MSGVDNTLETINAAATAIASVENRVPPPPPQASVQKRRWGSCWSIYWCFGSKKQNKRIGHAVVPETTASRAVRPSADNSAQALLVTLPFVAPPSSPVSFLPSDPPSVTQSPVNLISFSSISKNMYSPGGSASIFTIGPYAHETQLVSPPVFSTFTTEPSTAPFTPPPESVHLTTPSSPEVPFAKFLGPDHPNVDVGHRFPFSQYEFQSYQLQPGSPVSNLISPRSAISRSGTSSPFLDHEFTTGRPHFLEFKTGDPPKLLNLEKIAPHERGSRQGSGTLTPDTVSPTADAAVLNCPNSDIAPLSSSCNGRKNSLAVVDHRVSFEITAGEVVRCVEKKVPVLAKVGSLSHKDVGHNAEGEQKPAEMPNRNECYRREPSTEICEASLVDEEGAQQHQKQRSITSGSAKEFNFDNVNGGYPDKPNIGSDWWANEKVLGNDSAPCKSWTIFPILHPGVG